MKLGRMLIAMTVVISSFTLVGPVHGGIPVTKPAKPAVASDLQRGNPGVFRPMSSAAAPSRKYTEDSIIVKFKPGVADGVKNNLHKRHGSSAAKKFDRLRIHQVKLKKGMTVEDAIKLYKSDPSVEYAEPNYITRLLAVPNDPSLGNLWGLTRINAPAAWDTATGSEAVVVAVIDSGIDYTHPDLAANMWVNPWEIAANGVDDDGKGYVDDMHGIDALNYDSDPFDDHFHGTHVAGTIGAVGNNGVGVVGVNWNVRLMACKAFGSNGSGTIDAAIECLQYVRKMKDRGVNIVATNNSWGAAGSSQGLYDAVADQGDILFIASAGNDSANIDKTAVCPAGYDLPNVITVAATDENDNLASFSNAGQKSVHVAAPGTGIYSTSPGNSYQTLQGTSMAAPHVTGLAALLNSVGKDWKQAKNLILSGGDSVAGLAAKTITGRRINASNSISCSDRPFFALQSLPVSVQAGVPATLSAISINCSAPAGPVIANFPGDVTIPLHDDGIVPDKVAGDGIFAASWVPTGSAGIPVTFTHPTGNLTVAVPPLAISDTSTVAPPATVSGKVVNAELTLNFSQVFGAAGGILPYTWSIASGALPAGLTLDSATGEVSGTPTTAGASAFTVQVTDALGFSDSAGWTILISQGLQPGWPKTLQAKVPDGWIPTINSSPVFADLDNDGKQELIVTDLNTLYVFKEDALAARYDFPANITLYATPAVADLVNDGNKEIIISVNYPSTTAPIYAFDKDLNLLPGFPAGEFPTYWGSPGYCGSPIVADFNDDGNKTILLECSPNNTHDENFEKSVLVMVDPLGTMSSGWPKTVGPSVRDEWLYKQMPVVGDLFRDGMKKIVVINSDGMLRIFRKDGVEVGHWPAASDLGDWPAYGTKIWTPVLADIDSDGYLDIVVKQNYFADAVTQRHRISVFNRNGGLLPGWPLLFTELVNEGGVIAADIDNDSLPEIITNIQTGRFGEPAPLGIFYQWHAYRADGSPVAGWPLAAATGAVLTKSLPVTGGFSGNSLQDVFYATSDTDSNLWGYNAAGSLLAEFPKVVGLNTYTASSPALGDLDGNGRLDIAVKAEDGTLHVWESAQAASDFNLQWPMFAHDLQHTGALSAATGVNFSASPVSGAAPLLVNFTDTSTTSPVSWSWSFGDGGSSTDRNPQHTYTTPGAYTVSLTAANPQGSATKTKVALITVYAPLAIATSSLSSTTPGLDYSEGLTATGGLPPYTWTVISGSLPAGLFLNGSTGVISGISTSSGTANFTIRVTDATASTATKALSLTVVYVAPVITTASLPSAPVGQAYSQSLTVLGGAAPYTWSVISGSLPAGLTLNGATGVITGTPTSGGTAAFTIRVTDATEATATKTLSLTTWIPLTITTMLLPTGYNVVNSYSQELTATGGQPPYTWSVISGSLPFTLTLNSATGFISGTPQTLGTSTFTVQVSDATAATATKELSITVNSYVPISFNPAPLPHGTSGAGYSQGLTATGLAPLSWTISGTSGSLPDGLALDHAAGVIAGVPTAVGSYSFWVRVTDVLGLSSLKRLAIVIDDPFCTAKPVSITGTSSAQFDDFMSAYAQVVENDVQIRLHEAKFSGNMVLTKDYRVSLRGGYDCNYTDDTSSTQIVSGKLLVLNGSVKLDKLRFR